jgi:hypothetical protein
MNGLRDLLNKKKERFNLSFFSFFLFDQLNSFFLVIRIIH